MIKWIERSSGYVCRVGVNGRFLRFLQALFEGSMCRVKVNSQVSDDFEVNTGLRQKCVLSLLLFSLYINGAVHEEAERGQMWSGVWG